MSKRLRTLILTAAIGVASAACLSKDTSNTLCLDPDGAVTWSILHRNVRSDPAGEELEYMSAVVRDEHGVTRGLRALGGLDVSTQVLRTIRPFSVLAEGRFTGIDVLGQRLLDACGVFGLSTFAVQPGRLVDVDPHDHWRTRRKIRARTTTPCQSCLMVT